MYTHEEFNALHKLHDEETSNVHHLLKMPEQAWHTLKPHRKAAISDVGENSIYEHSIESRTTKIRVIGCTFQRA